jgi:hypothetical protein
MDDVEKLKRLKTFDRILTLFRILGLLLCAGALFCVWWTLRNYVAMNERSIMDKIRDPAHINMPLVDGCLLFALLVTVVLALKVMALERAESKMAGAGRRR